jgi:hypothetical protein
LQKDSTSEGKKRFVAALKMHSTPFSRSLFGGNPVDVDGGEVHSWTDGEEFNRSAAMIDPPDLGLSEWSSVK